MKAIQTKYLPCTNNRGSRVKAYAHGGCQVTISWDDALGIEENHDNAARALIAKYEWASVGIVHSGGSVCGKGFVYVLGTGYNMLSLTK